MAITIDQAFQTQFSADVKHAYQLNSRLLPFVKKRTDVTGSTTRFNKLGAVAAYQKTRNADLTVLEPATTYVDVTLGDWYATDMVDDLDLLKTNVSIRQEYVKNVSFALGKKIDDIILAALLAGGVAATTNTGAMSVARWLEIKKIHDNASVPQEDRKIVFGGASIEDLLATTQITSVDFNSMQSLVRGDLKTFLGYEVATVPDGYLSGTTDKINFAFHKESVGVAFGQDIKTMIEWSPDKHAWWIKATMSMGAGVIDTTGVTKFGITV